TLLPYLHPLSLHDALPILAEHRKRHDILIFLLPVDECLRRIIFRTYYRFVTANDHPWHFRPGKFCTHHNRQCKTRQRIELMTLRSEEHTSELQSRENLVCR